MAKKKKIDPPHTGVLKCDAPGGLNFVEAYGWNWWRSVVDVASAKGRTSSEDDDVSKGTRQSYSDEDSEDDDESDGNDKTEYSLFN